MITVLRESGFRIVIFLNDHLPEHVHVYGDGEARIDLGGEAGGAKVVWSLGMKRSDVRRAVSIVNAHRDDLILRWRELHG
ncbi:DUF4160 domain-containing protein [Mesorhizobium australicum]|uniref:DUF4160 domain-containing protein n=1 Tax=Mesorhizobium australicum TaxID=536018 RepID=A0A1X7PFY6_9HYPH|nr:DUF4160 domain-containing protein [Mesorhizobium australicum]SMH50382.1 protein of unknown function [Mesorhizobium australicum]